MPEIICEIGHNHLGNSKFLFDYLKKLDNKIVSGVSIQLKAPHLYSKEYKQYYLKPKILNKFFRQARKKFKYVGLATTCSSNLKLLDIKPINFIKILSVDLKNFKLIKEVKKTNKKIFLSTGFSKFDHIKKTLSIVGKKNIELIHTSFSKDKDILSLEKIDQLRKFKLPVSYGSHSANTKSIAYSVFFKPKFIFFYVKRNIKSRNIPFRDDKYSVKLGDIKRLFSDVVKFQKHLKIL